MMRGSPTRRSSIAAIGGRMSCCGVWCSLSVLGLRISCRLLMRFSLCTVPIQVNMSPGDIYLWTLPMFHANGWTFVWIVTAVGARHVCLRRVEPVRIFELINQENVTMLCAAPTVLIGVANTPAEARPSDLKHGL